MKCEDIRERIPDFLTGEIGPAERAAFDAHLAECPACAEELKLVSATWAKLGLLPAAAPSPALRVRFYEMLEAYKDGLQAEKAAARPAAAGRRSLLGRWLAAQPALAFGAAAVLIAVAGAAGFLAGGRGGAVSELRREVETIRQTAAVSLLAQPSTAERLRGVSYAGNVSRPGRPTLEALLRALDEDPSVNVRLAAVDALYLFVDQPGVKEGLVASLSRQTSPLVQVALIDLLVSAREKRAVEALKALAGNEKLDPGVREKATAGIKNLTL